MKTEMSNEEWRAGFLRLGIKPATATVWAVAFAAGVNAGTFSKGGEDLADFLPTILHESAMLEKQRESGNYSADRIRFLGNASAPGSRWRSLVARADELAHNEYKFFEACYGGRMGNGPEGSGDGSLYAGSGPIGVTGKDNFQWLAERAGQDVTMMPLLIVQPNYGLEFCIDWWEGRVPDRILGDERAIRKVVNGGYFGFAEVESLANRVREVFP